MIKWIYKTCPKYFIVIVLYRQPLFSYFDFEIYKCLHRICSLVGNGDRADFHDRNFFFHEQFSVIKAVSVLLIIIGVVSLNFISESETSSNGISVHTDRNR